MKTNHLTVLIAVLAASTLLLPTQSFSQSKLPTQKEIATMAAMHHAALQANRKVLQDYSWQYRTEVWQNEQLQWADLMNVNLDARGLPVFTQVNRQQKVPTARRIFAERSERKQREGFEEIDAVIKYVADWVTWYNRMPLSRVTELFDQAARRQGVSSASAGGQVLRINGRNIRDSNANDLVSLWMDKDSCHPLQFSFTVPVQKTADGAGGGKTITATIHYRCLRNGEKLFTRITSPCPFPPESSV